MFHRTSSQLEAIRDGMVSVYNSDRWSNGTYVRRTAEKMLELCSPGNKVNNRMALPVVNGTVAIEMAVRALGLEDSGVLLVPELTAAAVFMGTRRAKRRIPYRVEDHWDPDLPELPTLLGGSVVLYLVHTGGLIADNIDKIIDWCSCRGVLIIEDISHAQGSIKETTKGRYVAGEIGDIVIGSMYATKSLNSGEGGILVYPETLDHKMYPLWNAGRDRNEVQVTYDGGNARVSEFQAVVMHEALVAYDDAIREREIRAVRLTDGINNKDRIMHLKKSMVRFPFYKYILVGSCKEIAVLKSILPKQALSGLVHDRYYGGVSDLAPYGGNSLSLRHMCINLFMPDDMYDVVISAINEVLS